MGQQTPEQSTMQPSEPDSFFQTRGFKIGLLTAFGIGVLVLAGILRNVTTPIVIALVIAYVLDPVVLALERLKLPRAVGVTLVYVALLAVLVLIGATLGPAIYRQAAKLPGYVEQASRKLGLVEMVEGEQDKAEPETPSSPESEQPEAPAAAEAPEPASSPPDVSLEEPVADTQEPDSEEGLLATAREIVNQNLDKIAVKALAVFRAVVTQIAGSVGRIIGTATQIVLVFIYTFFFLLSLHPGLQKAKEYLPGRYRQRILDIVGKLDRAYSNFFRGRLIICLCSGALTSVGLWICGIPFWLLIGMTVGILGVIPFVGVMVGLIPALLLAVLMGGWNTVIGVLVVFAVVQAIEPLLTPIILSRGMKLHPLTILIGLLVGAELFGMFGAVIAVPLTSTAKILGREFLLPPLKELAEEEPKPASGQETDTT